MMLIFDFDFIKFEAACLAEERSIVVTHKASGRQMEFATRTDFWGNWRTKSGGWLAKANEGKKKPWTPDDFLIEDKQEVISLGHARKIVDSRIDSILKKMKTNEYHGYITPTGSKSFREEVSTLWQYKANRTGLIKPILLSPVADYIQRSHNGRFITHWEVDDKVVMDWYENKGLVVVGAEKDYMGCEINFFNPDTMDEFLKIRGLGGLWIDGNKEVKGFGRKWLYFQMSSNDSADNYAANCMSDVKWGAKSAYNVLTPCQTDKECFEAMIQIFKKLYPKPKVVNGWRGEEIEIDWLYVMNEMFQLARMRRNENDEFHVTYVLDKLGIEYETSSS